jgi:hypothetical protein
MPRLKSRPSVDFSDIQLLQAGSVAEALRLGLTKQGKGQNAKDKNAAQE